ERGQAMSGQFDGTGAGANAPPPAAKVATPPAYNVNGNVPVVNTVDSHGKPRKQAPFSFAGSFAPEDLSSGVAPRCGEIHQFIRWDKTWGVRPHKGFDSSTGPDTWVEDRDSNGKRYGHRNDDFSDPVANCGDECLSGTTQDQQGG